MTKSAKYASYCELIKPGKKVIIKAFYKKKVRNLSDVNTQKGACYFFYAEDIIGESKHIRQPQ